MVDRRGLFFFFILPFRIWVTGGNAGAHQEILFEDYHSIPLEQTSENPDRDGFMAAALDDPNTLLSRDSEFGVSTRKRPELLMTHRDFHFASVIHAIHRSRNGDSIDFSQYGKDGEQLAEERPIALPVIPKSPPVCSQPPAMRFCKNVGYPVYRPSADHTFAQLDFDSHAVFKKIAPHMRISEKHFNLSDIIECRANFRQFLCLRNFPRCCHVGLCSEYGAPEPALTTTTLDDGSSAHGAAAAAEREKATKVTFVNGSKDTMRVQVGRNDTVKVKVADAVCLQYVKTYTPLFDCRTQCRQLLSSDCLFMLDQGKEQECEWLCEGVHSEQCASKELFQIATGRPAYSPAPPLTRPTGLVLLAAAGIALLAAAAADVVA